MDKNGNDIFKLYKTFHDNKDSRGIGLFITKNQIEQMGGKIEVRSQLNEGTTFIIYLLTA
jgi:signal transduction histidine kinase